MRKSALAALLVVSTASAARAQESRSLQFAWPAGSTADVTVTSTTTASVMGQATSMDGEVTYRIAAEAEGDGLILRYSDFMFDGEQMEALAGTGNPEDLTRVLSGAQSDVRIDADGQFVGLVDYEGTRESLDAFLAPEMENLNAQGMGGILDDFIEATLSEEAMTDVAKNQWNQMVGFWAGRTLTVEEPVRVDTEMAFPILANTPVQLETELRLVGAADCPEGSQATRCIELASSASPDGEELRNLMDIFMAEMSEQAGGMGIEVGVTSMELRLESTLIMDEDTLRPLRMETTSDTAMEMDAMGMTQTMDNEQTVVTVFDWES